LKLSLPIHHQHRSYKAASKPRNGERALLCRGRAPPQVEVGHFLHTERGTFVTHHQQSQEGRSQQRGTRQEDEALNKEGALALPSWSSTMVATTEILECQCDSKSTIADTLHRHHIEPPGDWGHPAPGNNLAKISNLGCMFAVAPPEKNTTTVTHTQQSRCRSP
jgi:hypothetical protein